MISKQSFFVAIITINIFSVSTLHTRRIPSLAKQKEASTEFKKKITVEKKPLLHRAQNINLELVSPEFKHLLDQIFIHNNVKKIPNLIREINKSKDYAPDLYCEVVKWGLQNEYSAIVPFVKKLPNKLFRTRASHDEITAHYILIESIIHHSDALVPFLLEKMTVSELIKKDIEGFTALDYCLQSDNSDALSLITDKLKTIITPSQRNIIIRATASLLKNLIWGCISAGTITGIYYLVK